MNSKASSVAFLAVFLLFSSASAFNITRLLGRYPEFSTFNDYLTQTKLYEQINSRRTITVLVVDNTAIAAVAGKPLDVVKSILSVHVILDYFDLEKLTQLSNEKATQITTLYQASGVAQNQQGFLKIRLINEGEIAFGSASKGASMDSKLVQSVAAQPFNISVLQVTKIIQVPNLDPNPSPPPPPTAAPVAAPPKKVSPSTSPAKAPAPAAEGPSDTAADAPTPSSEAPDAYGPEADAAPIGSPIGSPLVSPPQPADDAEAPDSTPSGAASTVVGAGAFMGLVTFLVGFYV